MNETMKHLTQLCEMLRDAEAHVDTLTQQLAAAKERVRMLQEEDLPELMREWAITELKLGDGSSIKLINEVDCNISEDRRAGAHAWLAEHGFGGLIKSALTVEFGRNEHDEALLAASKIQDTLGRIPQFKEAVHPQTLKAFIKEQMAAGNNVPQELFGIRPYSKAKITLGRAK